MNNQSDDSFKTQGERTDLTSVQPEQKCQTKTEGERTDLTSTHDGEKSKTDALEEMVYRTAKPAIKRLEECIVFPRWGDDKNRTT